MKRFIAFLLAALLCIAALPTAVFASEKQFVYTEDDIEELYYDFEYLSGMVESIFHSDEGLAYWKYTNDMEGQKVAGWLID